MRKSSAPNYGIILLLMIVAAVGGGLVSRLVPLENEGGQGRTIALTGERELTLSPLVRETAPAVVNIAVLQPSPALQNPLLRDPFFRRYMGIPDAALQPAIS